MVKLMLDGRKTAVIVLGGAHDLSDKHARGPNGSLIVAVAGKQE